MKTEMNIYQARLFLKPGRKVYFTDLDVKGHFDNGEAMASHRSSRVFDPTKDAERLIFGSGLRFKNIVILEVDGSVLEKSRFTPTDVEKEEYYDWLMDQITLWIDEHPKDEIEIIGCKPTETGLPIGCSKVGGRPDVPDGFEWPRDFNGNPFSLILQIDCADLAESDQDNLLPHVGHFYVFYEYLKEQWDDGEFHGFSDYEYWSKKKEDGFLYYSDAPTESLHREDYPEGMDDWHQIKERPVEFRRVISYPWDRDLARELGCLYASRDYETADWYWYRAASRHYETASNGGFGGDDIVVGHLLGYPGQLWPHRFDKDEVLLIELNYETEYDYMFGDAADIFFYISSENLKSGALDKYKYECNDGY